MFFDHIQNTRSRTRIQGTFLKSGCWGLCVAGKGKVGKMEVNAGMDLFQRSQASAEEPGVVHKGLGRQ